MHNYYIYILASKLNGTLYTGVTSDLIRRVYEHQNKLILGFSKQYGISDLVYFEQTSDVISAISREKEIKGKGRHYKIDLIELNNPNWEDLYPGLI